MTRTSAIALSTMGLFLAASIPAKAASLFLVDVSPTAGMHVTFPGNDSFDTPFVGSINWSFNRADTGNALLDTLVQGTTLSTFCIEGTQNVYIQQQANFGAILTDPAQAPKDNVGSNYAMGPVNAATLSHFWDAYYGISGDSAVNSAAFQLGIWEIVYDGGLAPNFNAGGFQASAIANDQTSADALSQSASWLSNLGSVNPATHYQLFVLSDAQFQDQLFGVQGAGAIPATPLPAAMPMGLALMTGIAAIRKWKSFKNA